jgi:hypothetical protein
MKRSLVLLLLVACSKDNQATVTEESMKVDKVKNQDGPIASDGKNDAAISLSVEGPIAGLVMLSTDKDGNPFGMQQWDTYVGDEKLPAAAKAPFPTGGTTWQLGVFEDGKPLNTTSGSLVPLGVGMHKLTLYAGDSGWFTKANHFVIFVERPDHSVVRSNLFTF